MITIYLHSSVTSELLSAVVQVEMQIEEFVEDESRVDKPKPQ